MASRSKTREGFSKPGEKSVVGPHEFGVVAFEGIQDLGKGFIVIFGKFFNIFGCFRDGHELLEIFREIVIPG